MRRPAPRPEGFPTRLQAVVDRFGSVRALAKATGQAPKTISDWLTGARLPHASTMKKFCEKADVIPNWLLHGSSIEEGIGKSSLSDGATRSTVEPEDPVWGYVRGKMAHDYGDAIDLVNSEDLLALDEQVNTLLKKFLPPPWGTRG